MRQYLIVIARDGNQFVANCPDVEGCRSSGATVAEVTERMQEALQFRIHCEFDEEGEVPDNRSIAAFVSVTVPHGKTHEEPATAEQAVTRATV